MSATLDGNFPMRKDVLPVIFPSIDWQAVSRNLVLLLFAAGTGVWGALLFAPKPASVPAALPQVSTQGVDTAPVASWFGGGTTRLRVAVAGLMATSKGGAALLTINGGPAQAYRAGQELAPGVTLTGVRPDGVLVNQDGTIQHIPAPARPATVDGFVRVARAR